MPFDIPSKDVNTGKIRHRVLPYSDWSGSLKSGNGNGLFPGQLGVSTGNTNGNSKSGLTYVRIGPTTTPDSSGKYPATVWSGSLKIVPEDETLSNSMLAKVSSKTIKGNRTTGTGYVEDLTASQVTGILDSYAAAGSSVTADSGSANRSLNQSRGLVDINAATDTTWLGSSTNNKVLRRDGKWADQIKVNSGVAVSSTNGTATDTITMTPTLSGSTLSFSLTHPNSYSASKLTGTVAIKNGGLGSDYSASVASNNTILARSTGTTTAGSVQFRSLILADLPKSSSANTVLLGNGTATAPSYGVINLGTAITTGILTVSKGGTGVATIPSGSGNVWFGGARGSAPGWSTPTASDVGARPSTWKPSLASEVSGILPVANGGTGTSSLTANRVLLTSSSGIVTTIGSAGSADQPLVSNGTTAVWGNNITVSGNVKASALYTTSDRRLKENITEFTTDKSVLDIPIYRYNYKDSGKESFGFIAQDLQEVFPELVSENSDNMLVINESKLIYLLMLEVKKLRDQLNK